MKKIGLYTLSLVLFFLLGSCLTNLTGTAVAEEPKKEVMEVRIYLEDGKIVHVEGIDKEKYGPSESFPNLAKESGIQHSMTVLTQHNSPGCLIWGIEKTETSYTKVCLLPTP